jgi:hypothetical protein
MFYSVIEGKVDFLIGFRCLSPATTINPRFLLSFVSGKILVLSGRLHIGYNKSYALQPQDEQKFSSLCFGKRIPLLHHEVPIVSCGSGLLFHKGRRLPITMFDMDINENERRVLEGIASEIEAGAKEKRLRRVLPLASMPPHSTSPTLETMHSLLPVPTTFLDLALV